MSTRSSYAHIREVPAGLTNIALTLDDWVGITFKTGAANCAQSSCSMQATPAASAIPSPSRSRLDTVIDYVKPGKIRHF